MENRRSFLVRVLALPFAAAFMSRFLAACGQTSETTATGCAAGVTAASGGGHVHYVTITRDDIVAGAQKTFTVTDNGNGHTHQVVVTAAQMTDLNNNTGISATTLADSTGHDHTFTISC
jgi:hypothetical protein